MPKIREMATAGQQGIQGNFDRAVTSDKELGTVQAQYADQTGRLVGNAISGVGEVLQKRQEAIGQQEVTTGAASYATMLLNSSDDWNSALKAGDPNDPTIGQSFLEGKQKEYQDWADSFTTDKGKAWASQKAVEAYTSLAKTVHGDTSTLAGINATNNVNTYADGIANFAHDNPEQVDSILSGVDKDIPALVPDTADAAVTLKARTESATTVKQAILAQAMGGMIDKNPEAFLKSFDAGDFKKYADAGLIDAKTYAGIRNVAEQKVRTNTSAAAADAALQTKKERAAVEGATTSLVQSTVAPDGTRSVNGDFFKAIGPGGAVSSMPGFTREDFTVLDNWGHAIQTESLKGNKDDADVVADFNSRAETSLTKTEVMQAELAGKLTTTKGDQYFKALDTFHPKDPTTSKNPLPDQITRDQYDRAKNVFALQKNPAGIAIDPATNKEVSPARLQVLQAQNDDFQTWFLSSFQNGLAANPPKTAQQMLDPSSPDYLPRHYPGQDPNKIIKPPAQQPLTFNSGVPNPAGAATVRAAPGVAPAPNQPTVPKYTQEQANAFVGNLFSGNPNPPPKPAAPAPVAGVSKTSYTVPPNKDGEAPPAQSTAQAVPSGKTIQDLMDGGHTSPTALAVNFLNENEIDNKSTISAFIKQAAGIDIDPSKTAWCAAWANAILAASGYQQGRGGGAKGTVGNGMWAFDFENYGTNAVGDEKEGDVVVFRWKAGGGHVGFFMGYQEVNGRKMVAVLGGNQGGDKMNGGGVSISLEPADQISAIRHPAKYTGSDIPANIGDAPRGTKVVDTTNQSQLFAGMKA